MRFHGPPHRGQQSTFALPIPGTNHHTCVQSLCLSYAHRHIIWTVSPGKTATVCMNTSLVACSRLRHVRFWSEVVSTGFARISVILYTINRTGSTRMDFVNSFFLSAAHERVSDLVNTWIKPRRRVPDLVNTRRKVFLEKLAPLKFLKPTGYVMHQPV